MRNTLGLPNLEILIRLWARCYGMLANTWQHAQGHTLLLTVFHISLLIQTSFKFPTHERLELQLGLEKVKSYLGVKNKIKQQLPT